MRNTNLTEEIDNNQYSFFLHLAKVNGFSHNEGRNYSFVKSGLPVWCNFIFDLKNPDGAVVEELSACIEKKEIPDKIVGSLDFPHSEAEAKIITDHFVCVLENAGMFLNSKNFRYSPINPDLTIVECKSREDYLKWSEIVGAYLFKNYSPKNAGDFAGMIRTTAVHGKLIAYLGLYNGKPAASSACYIENDTAGIYFVAVPDEFRKMGFGYEITAKCILEGMNTGIDDFILHASAMGKPVYQKFEFEAAGIKKRFVHRGLL